MAGVWAKVDALLPVNPKCYRAGFWGTNIFLHLVLLNRAHHCKGALPITLADPDFLASYLRMDGEVADAASRVREGLRNAEQAGLIEVADDVVTLVGWDRSWGLSASDTNQATRERKRKQRERQGLVSFGEEVNATLNIIPVGAARSDESHESHDNSVTCHDVTMSRQKRDMSRCHDERRGEEKREDLTLPSGNGAWGGEAPLQGTEQVPARQSPEKKKRKGKKPVAIPEQAHVLAHVLADYVVERNPDVTLAKLPPARRTERLAQWANVIRLMHQQDGHGWTEIQSTLEWAQRDSFWRGVVVNPKSLRKHWDKLVVSKYGKSRNGRAVPDGIASGQITPKHHTAHPDGEVEL